jgi:hypothetical protein
MDLPTLQTSKYGLAPSPRQSLVGEFRLSCGAGMPCECNRAEGYVEPDTSRVLECEDVQLDCQRNADGHNLNPKSVNAQKRCRSR